MSATGCVKMTSIVADMLPFKENLLLTVDLMSTYTTVCFFAHLCFFVCVFCLYDVIVYVFNVFARVWIEDCNFQYIINIWS
jgi:hypothetical protein